MVGTLQRPVSIINDNDVRDASEIHSNLAEFLAEKNMKITLLFPGGELIELPVGLTHAVIDLLMAIGVDRSIAFEKIPQELSTIEAARKLGVSRPTLMKMIRNKEIDAHTVGSHHRLKTKDVFAFMKKRIELQKNALNELLELEGSLDI